MLLLWSASRVTQGQWVKEDQTIKDNVSKGLKSQWENKGQLKQLQWVKQMPLEFRFKDQDKVNISDAFKRDSKK